MNFKKFIEGIEYKELQGTKGNHASYHVRHAVEDGRHVFKVFHQANKVAEAKLGHTGEYVTDLQVREDHRRKGIASALYKHIEKHIGKPLVRSTHQTPDGNAFWKSREKGK